MTRAACPVLAVLLYAGCGDGFPRGIDPSNRRSQPEVGAVTSGDRSNRRIVVEEAPPASDADSGRLVDPPLPVEEPNPPPSEPGTTPPGAPPPPAPSTPPSSSTPGSCGNAYETEVLKLVNEERAKQNLSALTCDAAAGKAARAYSQQMCDENFFSHTGPDGSTPASRLKAAGATYVGAGENIALGQPTPAQVMKSWMTSPGHRANILGPFTHL
ncbi:MAG: hypothetical protein IT371_10115, partial [Deltaproteobacteria bacterium]|nr:hypothetical protein [Deltaproteobacteria bacterium]